jgi:outer membrane lipoprotein-sorting protein
MNFNTLILYVTLFLALAIFISVLFGCAFRKNKESFTNAKNGLSKFENQMLQGISGGNIGADKISELIKRGKFTQKNLENMIKQVEKMKNGGKKK